MSFNGNETNMLLKQLIESVESQTRVSRLQNAFMMIGEQKELPAPQKHEIQLVILAFMERSGYPVDRLCHYSVSEVLKDLYRFVGTKPRRSPSATGKDYIWYQ